MNQNTKHQESLNKVREDFNKHFYAALNNLNIQLEDCDSLSLSDVASMIKSESDKRLYAQSCITMLNENIKSELSDDTSTYTVEWAETISGWCLEIEKLKRMLQ